MLSRDYVAIVGDGPEFGFIREIQGDLEVVPVIIDISADEVLFSFPPGMAGTFVEAAFNGYVLTFPAECTLITGASIDRAVTTLPLDDADLAMSPTGLSLDVAGLTFDDTSRIGVRLDVTDCVVS